MQKSRDRILVKPIKIILSPAGDDIVLGEVTSPALGGLDGDAGRALRQGRDPQCPYCA